MKENKAIDNIMSRISVRAFTDRKIDTETLDTVLHAAMAAPSAGNKQPLRMVVINDRTLLDWIADNFNTMTMARHADVAVLMCGDINDTFAGDGRDYWIEDVSAASENLLLAAHAVGLGAVWCGIYPLPDRIGQFSDKFRLPENIVPMGCICMGYPAPKAEHAPIDKWKPEHIRYNFWND